MFRLLVIGSILATVIVSKAVALVHIEDDEGREWECDSFYCYSDEARKERDEFNRWLKEDDVSKAKYTKDPLNMSARKDPLAMPKFPKINKKDPLAF